MRADITKFTIGPGGATFFTSIRIIDRSGKKFVEHDSWFGDDELSI
jgi:hypothetical protein